MALPDFTWCPAPGYAVAKTPRMSTVNYGDGYVHRFTTGINVIQRKVSVVFNGDQDTIAAIDAFLEANYLRGFNFTFAGPDVVVTCDTWTVTWQDRQASGKFIGSLTAEFNRSYNIQPGS